MFDPNANVSPINRIPPVILIIFLVSVGFEVAFQLTERDMIGHPEWLGLRNSTIQQFGFINSVFDYMLTVRDIGVDTLPRFLTYPFLHYSLQHSIFGVLMFLAVGKGVADHFHPMAVLALFMGVSIAGALAVGVLGSHNHYLIGLFTPIYGFLGAIVWMLIYKPHLARRGSRTAFQIVGFLIVMQVVFHFAIRHDDEWLNRFAALGTGFLLSFVLAPDGRARLRSWVDAARQR